MSGIFLSYQAESIERILWLSGLRDPLVISAFVKHGADCLMVYKKIKRNVQINFENKTSLWAK